jgi:hypothetical protein
MDVMELVLSVGLEPTIPKALPSEDRVYAFHHESNKEL